MSDLVVVGDASNCDEEIGGNEQRIGGKCIFDIAQILCP
jgi:hypothetical protein